ncbi:uroporphyrinogen-III C-methyltransferase [Meiothermus ruber]|jgi:uroporphyrin-III C-methyltransferase|uniref:uroporphyrinogen-III C-methyltransferase n=1 Tax=Meiothermus ruber (strain ATCC 35948 / DSM 1279 / VKM B-1258 / 21) TaxID=504728 RepID=D3PPZ2_MEIRD|nr:uroporphyrinogen-III C-methyltransferase [Meiothermus ruber]GIW39382.1 MAG: uroporphyrin-III C-methyltransferase [Meiothermus sp.]ADD27618.1 uroporphyrin-III C-methyltransferase [Meiothermus ruber DSM 1279]AGK04083.1 uroporphyrin-III C-methyltransferase [Meiothermus ruber DSM 1279]MCL6531133.1 uroporphyrinogen-III C-methyltransferase [Meiothermus ruber]GAO74546.1 uroporphyrin-III C-methyltransferase [Meiothermus ruber H328]
MSPVYLVGAGPGSADLLTLRAARVLQEAEVVLYDRLVSPEVLALVNPRAQRIYVGKTKGEQDKQQQILHLLLSHARAGRKVVRLKGGDPMVFGRGAEEWLHLAQAGLPVELVPGLSSAVALPGLWGIPLTMRGLASGFAVISGQMQEGAVPNLAAYAQVDTLVILMGVERRVELARALLQAGRPPREPAAFIENGTTPSERLLLTDLQAIAQGRVEVQAPAVWIQGSVVGVQQKLRKTKEEYVVAV